MSPFLSYPKLVSVGKISVFFLRFREGQRISTRTMRFTEAKDRI